MVKALCWNSLRYAVGLTVLAYVIKANWTLPASSGIADAFRTPTEMTPLLLATGAGLLSLTLMSIRWYIVARVQELPVSLLQAFRFGALGYFMGTILPGSAGGDVTRAILIARGQARRTLALSTVLVDGAIAFWTLLLLISLVGSCSCFLGDPELNERTRLSYFVIAGLGAVMGGMLAFIVMGALQPRHWNWLTLPLARLPRIRTIIVDVLIALRMYRRRAGMTALAVIFSLGSQIATVVSFFLAAEVFVAYSPTATVPSLAQHFIIVPIGMLIQFGFPAPGGIGGCEYGYGVLYALAMGNAEATAAGVLASLVFRAITITIGLIGYVFYLLTGPLVADLPSVSEEARERLSPAA
jgi:glycosyltransferase 2 family protein